MIHHIDTPRFLLGALALDGARLGHSCNAVRDEDRAILMMSEGTQRFLAPWQQLTLYVLIALAHSGSWRRRNS
jgi:hypothetical protein